MRMILFSIFQMLQEPIEELSVDHEITMSYHKEYDKFVIKAKEWVDKYSHFSINQRKIERLEEMGFTRSASKEVL